MNTPTEAGPEVVAWQCTQRIPDDGERFNCVSTNAAYVSGHSQHNWIDLVRKSDADAKEAATRAELARLQEIGALMANTMFNLAQHPGRVLTDAECATFKSMQVKWDAARSEIAATPKKE